MLSKSSNGATKVKSRADPAAKTRVTTRIGSLKELGASRRQTPKSLVKHNTPTRVRGLKAKAERGGPSPVTESVGLGIRSEVLTGRTPQRQEALL